MEILFIKDKEYEVLNKDVINPYRKYYTLKNLYNNQHYALIISDYRKANFVVEGNITAQIHKIGTSPLFTVKNPDEIIFKTISSKKTSNKLFKRFNFNSGTVDIKRHIAKTLTWRVLGTIDTIILSYLITGNMKIGFTIGSVEVFTKMILYYLHERTWYKFSKFGVKK